MTTLLTRQAAIFARPEFVQGHRERRQAREHHPRRLRIFGFRLRNRPVPRLEPIKRDHPWRTSRGLRGVSAWFSGTQIRATTSFAARASSGELGSGKISAPPRTRRQPVPGTPPGSSDMARQRRGEGRAAGALGWEQTGPRAGLAVGQTRREEMPGACERKPVGRRRAASARTSLDLGRRLGRSDDAAP